MLGWEAAGTVHRLGVGVTQFKVGERAMTYAFRRGAYAELVATPADQAASAPGEADGGCANPRWRPAIFARPSGERLAELARLVDAGQLKIEVHESYPLADAALAHAAIEAGHVRGSLCWPSPERA